MAPYFRAAAASAVAEGAAVAVAAVPVELVGLAGPHGQSAPDSSAAVVEIAEAAGV